MILINYTCNPKSLIRVSKRAAQRLILGRFQNESYQQVISLFKTVLMTCLASQQIYMYTRVLWKQLNNNIHVKFTLRNRTRFPDLYRVPSLRERLRAPPDHDL